MAPTSHAPAASSNIPYVQLSPMAFSGVFESPHPPSTHAYRYFKSFDWPGFNAPSVANAPDILTCIKLSILYDYNFFSFQNSTKTCHFKVPTRNSGYTMVFPTNATIPCPPTGKPGCINEMKDTDFSNAFSVMDRKGKALKQKAKDVKACAKLCYQNRNICAAASYYKGSCYFKQPIKLNDSTYYAGVTWLIDARPKDRKEST